MKSKTLRIGLLLALLLALVIANTPARASWTDWIDLSAPPNTIVHIKYAKVIAGVGGALNIFLANESAIWRGYHDDSGGDWQWEPVFSGPPNLSPGYDYVCDYDVVLKSNGLFEVYATRLKDFSLWRIRQKPDQTWAAPELYPSPADSTQLWYVNAVEDSLGQVVLFAKGDKNGNRALWHTAPKALVGDASQWTQIGLPTGSDGTAFHLGEVRLDPDGHLNLFLNVGTSLHDKYVEVWHLRQKQPGLFAWQVQKLVRPQELGTAGYLIQPLTVELNSKGAFELFTFGDEPVGTPGGNRIWHVEQDAQTGLWGSWSKFVDPPFTTSFQPPHTYPDIAVVKRKLSKRLTRFTTDQTQKAWNIYQTPASADASGWSAWGRVKAGPSDGPGRLSEIEVAETASGELWLFGIESVYQDKHKLWLTKLVPQDLKMQPLPKSVFEALRRCSDACINTHCAGTKIILLPDMSVELFEPNPPTEQVCGAAATRAVEGKEALAIKLKKTGLEGYLDVQRGDGSFWATQYLECQAKCQVWVPK
jgi:hypothetical protein